MDKILETLKMQPLTEEEKSSRHILGRLYGPIATSLESTRNGRKYNKQLWEKALADDIFQEKLATKSLFLELGHPTDREETDMTKVCACIPEMPKIVNGDLYTYVDILDTPNGKLLKTFCDYGFIPGISSRGSGDIMANDEVDPETFFLETWDIVQLPAVKKARLSMCESYNGKTLKTALAESYSTANESEKKLMKEALENLEFDMEFTEPGKAKKDIKEAAELTVADIDWANLPEASDDNDILVEDNTEDDKEISKKEYTDLDKHIAKTLAADREISKNTYKEEIDTEEAEEIIEDEIKEEPVEEEIPAEIPVEEVANTIKDTIEEIKEIVKANKKEIKAIDEVVEEKLKELLPEDKEDEQPEEEIPEGEDIEENSDDEEVKEVEEESEEAIDDGLEEALSNLKEMIRQKGLLENEIKALKSKKAVSDAEVVNLKEELNKYKTGFMRVSELASKATQFEKDVQSLNEQLALKDKKLKDLQTKSKNDTTLTESVNAQKAQVKSLTEKLNAMQKDLTASETKLHEQNVQYKNKLTEAIAVAKDYRAKYDSVLKNYVELRASMLGVKPATIINQLNENYSINDINKVCEELLDSSVGFNNLPFSFGGSPRVKINESKQKTQEDDDLEDLYILAGLK